MRCLESFVHLCAIGMFDEKEINILALDTDRDNGNFRRLKDLINVYNQVKGVDKDHFALKDTFFSAKINYFEFSPDYGQATKFSQVTDLLSLRGEDKIKANLVNLLFTKNTREFDLKHGYRAQTHLGSFLMYHSIVDEFLTNNNGHLAKFIDTIVNTASNDSVKAFVMGSVFGGTGASSIPIIPKAFNTAVASSREGRSLSNVYFGSTLLTNYFTFDKPSNSHLSSQKIVATAEKFAMNSQAAMMFYNEDETVKEMYQKFYMIGTQNAGFKTTTKSTTTLTGGAKQENDSHYIELLAAFAAYDFFKTPKNNLENIKNEKRGVKYYFRTVEDDGKLDFGDFIDIANAENLAQKIGLFTVMSFIVNLKKYDFFEAARKGKILKNIDAYKEIDPREVEALKRYFDLYHFKVDYDNGRLKNGWLRQLHFSAGGGDKFLLNSKLFSCNNLRELERFDFNKKIYLKNYEHRNYSVSFFSSAYDTFEKYFKEETNDDPAITNKCEVLIKRMRTALNELYKFTEINKR